MRCAWSGPASLEPRVRLASRDVGKPQRSSNPLNIRRRLLRASRRRRRDRPRAPDTSLRLLLSRSPAVSNGSIARSMRASSAVPLAPRGLARAAPRTRAARGRIADARDSRNPGARSGLPRRRAASLKLAAAKYSSAERLKSARIGHVRVERGDELFGHVEFVRGDARVRAQAPPRARGRRSFLRGSRGAARSRGASAGSRSRAADRSRRLLTAAAPISVPRPAAAEGQSRRVDERQHRPRAAKLFLHRRQHREQPLPRRRAVSAAIAAATGSVSAAPALVTPLLKRSIQIQPPGNT